jgi:hypothetical protein
MDTTDPHCLLCSKEVTSREHALCCDLCDRWHHQRCMKMPAADYKDYSRSEEKWYCPGCKPLSPTSYRLQKSCLSSTSDESNDEDDTQLDIDQSQTNNHFNSGTVTLTPARILLTPAPCQPPYLIKSVDGTQASILNRVLKAESILLLITTERRLMICLFALSCIKFRRPWPTGKLS